MVLFNLFQVGLKKILCQNVQNFILGGSNKKKYYIKNNNNCQLKGGSNESR